MANYLILNNPDIGNASEAYSVARRLKSSATLAFQIEASTGETQDIGFVSNLVDESAINTFAGTYGEARINTLYDQTGNGWNATQSTYANMPRIHDGVSLDKVNSRLAMFWDARNCWLETTGAPTYAPASYTLSMVHKYESTADNTQTIVDSDSGDAQWVGMGGSTNIAIAGNTIVTALKQQRFIGLANGAYSEAASGGSSTGTYSAPVTNMAGLTIGNLRDPNRGVNWEHGGYIQEVIRWGSVKTLSTIQADVQDFYFDLNNNTNRGGASKALQLLNRTRTHRTVRNA